MLRPTANRNLERDNFPYQYLEVLEEFLLKSIPVRLSYDKIPYLFLVSDNPKTNDIAYTSFLNP